MSTDLAPSASTPVQTGLDRSDLVAVAERIVGQAQRGEQVEVMVAADSGTEIRAHQGAIESLSVADTVGVGIRVVVDGRQGFAWTGTLDDDAVTVTLAEARDNARFATNDEHAGLAEPEDRLPATLDVYHPGVTLTTTDAKVALALELERAARSADARITGIESAEYADTTSVSAVVSTTGVHSMTAESACWLAVHPLAGHGDATQTGFGFSVARHPGDLVPSVAAADAARRATRMLGAVRPATGHATLVLDPWVTAQLLGIVGQTLTGDAAQTGRSPFADRLGEPIGSPLLTLVDDPTNACAFSATTHDGEGLATRRNVLIADGVLAQFVHNAVTARRAGTMSTGNAVRRGFSSAPGVGCTALALAPGSASQADLVAQVGDGILITDVAGLHSGVNPVSGDVSVGAEGLAIRGGALAEPLREFTIASTIQRLLTGVEAVGSDVEWLPMGAAGVSLVVRGVMVSGT